MLASFTLVGQLWLHFSVAPSQILTALVVVVGLDLTLTRWQDRRWAFPLSPVISGLSIGLLIRSDTVWPFVLAAAVAASSKHLLCIDGRHFLNPSCVGIVAALALTNGYSWVAPGQWGTAGLVLFAVASAGVLVGWRVRRLVMVAAFLLAHLAAVVVVGGWPAAGIAEVVPASVLLFAFFMLTDPRTSPSTRPAAVAYAAGLGVLAQVIDLGGSMYGPFLALLLVGTAAGTARHLVGLTRPAVRPAGSK